MNEMNRDTFYIVRADRQTRSLFDALGRETVLIGAQ